MYPAVPVDGAGKAAVSHAGGAQPTETALLCGQIGGVDWLPPWAEPLAVHGPPKVVLNLPERSPCRDCPAAAALLQAASEWSGWWPLT